MLILRNSALIAFEAVVNLGTTHAAAKSIGITQTAVTQRIKTLEGELSMTLFLRSRRGMTLTEEGRALLQFCRESRELEGLFASKVAGDKRQEVQLTIVGPTSTVSTRIAESVKSIYLKHSFVRLHLKSDDHSDLIEVIRRGEADLAVVTPSIVPNEMDSKMLKPDKYFLVASPKWKGRKLIEIIGAERIIDFYESDLTTKKYLAKFGLDGSIGRERLFINENEALIRMFKAGIGFGTLTESVAKPFLENGQLIALNQGQTLDDPLALVWYRRSRQMEYFEDLLRSIK